MAIDFHTHTFHPGVTELVSIPAPAAAGAATLVDDAGHFRSLEYHPWQLPAEFFPPQPPPEELLAQFDALGEIGLDRLRGPALPVQLCYLKLLLSAARRAGKPVVIHCVRCDAELLGLISREPNRFLIHGFRGGPRRLAALLDAGFTVSLAPFAWTTPGVPELLRTRRAARIGLETDDRQDTDIAQLTAKAADFLRMPELPEILDANFHHFLTAK